MSDNKAVKGGKRKNAGRKATKSGSGKSIYIPSDLIREVEERIKSYKETTKGDNS